MRQKGLSESGAKLLGECLGRAMSVLMAGSGRSTRCIQVQGC